MTNQHEDKIDLDQLEELARAATPGPWTYHYEGGGDYPVVKWDKGEEVEIVCCSRYHCEQDHETMSANAQYLCTLDPKTVMGLIALARKAQEPESAPIPTSVNMARLMLALSYKWLKENAPQHVPAQEPAIPEGTLPPLPEPDHALDCGAQPFYNPDQMRDYARSAIAAAGVAPQEPAKEPSHVPA